MLYCCHICPAFFGHLLYICLLFRIFIPPLVCFPTSFSGSTCRISYALSNTLLSSVLFVTMRLPSLMIHTFTICHLPSAITTMTTVHSSVSPSIKRAIKKLGLLVSWQPSSLACSKLSQATIKPLRTSLALLARGAAASQAHARPPHRLDQRIAHPDVIVQRRSVCRFHCDEWKSRVRSGGLHNAVPVRMFRVRVARRRSFEPCPAPGRGAGMWQRLRLAIVDVFTFCLKISGLQRCSAPDF